VSPSGIVDVIHVLLIPCSFGCPHWVWDVPHQLPPPNQSLGVKIAIPLPVSLFFPSSGVFFGFKARIL